MMTYLVQDLLDFAQIKGDKFRKNIREFNIEKSIQKVMKMHRIRVNEAKVTLKSTFHNFETADGEVT